MLRALVLTAALFVSATAAAQSSAPHRGGGRADAAANRADAVTNRVEARDDTRDLATLENLRNDYARAVARRDFRSARLLEGRVQTELRREIAEGRSELRNERREGDRREARVEQTTLASTERVLRDFERLAGRFDRRALNDKRVLLDEAVNLARTEASRNGWTTRGQRYGRG